MARPRHGPTLTRPQLHYDWHWVWDTGNGELGNNNNHYIDPEGKLVRSFSGPDENHFDNFIKAVRSGRREDLNAEISEGHQSTALCHVGNISHRLGQSAAPAEIQQQVEKLGMHEEVGATVSRTVCSAP